MPLAAGRTSDGLITAEGYFARIDEWVERTQKGFRPEDFALDAHLSFGNPQAGVIATVDLSSLGLNAPRHIGDISADWNEPRTILDIRSGHSGSTEGRCYLLSDVLTPPREFEGLRALLAANQQNNFDRRLNALSNGKSLVFLFAWDRDLGRDVLVLHATRDGEHAVTRAIEVAPTDLAVLRVRARPDADDLKDKSVLVFGVGSVGSNVCVRLSECGLGRLVCVDNQQLRPGDVVRHAASRWAVGELKTEATRFLVHARAPWTQVEKVDGTFWNPQLLREAVRTHDLVVDATGVTGFVSQLSMICDEARVPLLSVALYRGGSLRASNGRASPETR